MGKRLLKGTKGFSVLEAAIASASVAILVLGSATILSDGARISNFTEFQSVLNQIHNGNTHKIRHMENLRTAMAGVVPLSHPCFKGQKAPSGCSSFNMTSDQTVPNLFDNEQRTIALVNPADPSVAQIQSSITYRVQCTPEKCHRIIFTLVTAPNQSAIERGYAARPRRSQVSFPMRFLSDQQNISFSCGDTTAEPPVFSVDYNTLSANCDHEFDAPGSSNCGGGMPLKAYGESTLQCQNNLAANCANGGIRSFSLIAGQPPSICNTP